MDNRIFSKILAFITGNAPTLIRFFRANIKKAQCADFLAFFLIRLYLAPVLWMAGTRKFVNFSETAEWFGNTETGLGFPAPYLLVFLVGFIETLGALFLLAGFATRFISIPLMIIVAVAGYTVHLPNGWPAIAGGSGFFPTERTVEAMQRLEKAKEILQSQGDYAWLTEHGNFVILNNGVEFAATYFIMLLTLFFAGGGRYLSADYWLARRYFDS